MPITMRKLIGVACFGILLVLPACSSTSQSTKAARQQQETTVLPIQDYKIGVDDRVQVNVWRNPDLSITVPVRPDGKISVPLIGEVVAGGKTPLVVAGEITRRLAYFIKDPRVSVILTDLRSHEFLSRVRVTGAVRTPRSMNYRQGMTVLDVVLEAGGLNDFASANSTKLYRRKGDRIITIEIHLADILESGELETNISLRPGDIVTVPERLF